MKTLRQVISDVRSMNKLYSQDNTITDRAIAGELRSAGALLLHRDTALRRLLASPTLFSKVKCIKMCSVPLAECCDYQSDCKIRKSQCKVEGVADLGALGLAIQGVFSIDGSKKFTQVSPARYANLLTLKTPTKYNYYWFQDGYIYITDPNVELINLIAYFPDDVKLIGENCQCEEEAEQACINPLDKEFKYPDYLLEGIKSMANEKIMNIYRRSEGDQSSDEIEQG